MDAMLTTQQKILSRRHMDNRGVEMECLLPQGNNNNNNIVFVC